MLLRSYKGELEVQVAASFRDLQLAANRGKWQIFEFAPSLVELNKAQHE